MTTVVGTRPEVVKLSRVIAELDRYTDHRLIHTGQNYDDELNEVFFRELEIRPPDRVLDVAAESAAATIGNVIRCADEELAGERPDAVLIYGDTNSALAGLAAEHGRRVVVSTHPRTRRRLGALGEGGVARVDGVEFLPAFGFLDYVQLQRHALCVLSDSGTLTEEAAILGFPAVILRDAHERPEGMDAGVAVMSGLAPERVLQAVALATAQGPRSSEVPDYGPLDVSRKVVRIILSYVDYVQRVVWSRCPA